MAVKRSTPVSAANLRQKIVETCLAMNDAGINQGMSGNVSSRYGSGCLITSSGVPYERMGPKHIIRINAAGGYTGVAKPSSEWRMHVDIYSNFNAAGAVVHAHPPHSTALACLRRGIPAFHYMVAVAGGCNIRCADYATFGTPELSANMLAALESRSACLLANHGIICFGRDLEEAFWRAGEVESLAQQYLLSLNVGEPVLLDEQQMAEVLELFRTYGNQDSREANPPKRKSGRLPPVR